MATPVIHFEVHASNPDRAIAFYESVLNWQVNVVPQMEQGYWLLHTRPEGEDGINGGMLRRKGGDPPMDAPVSGFVCVVQVVDLEGTLAKVESAGGAIALQPFDVEAVGRVAYIKDTEANTLGLLQPQ